MFTHNIHTLINNSGHTGISCTRGECIHHSWYTDSQTLKWFMSTYNQDCERLQVFFDSTVLSFFTLFALGWASFCSCICTCFSTISAISLYKDVQTKYCERYCWYNNINRCMNMFISCRGILITPTDTYGDDRYDSIVGTAVIRVLYADYNGVS